MDETVVLRREPIPGTGMAAGPPPRAVTAIGRRTWFVAGGVVCAGVVLAAGYFLTRPTTPPRVAAIAPVKPVAPAVPGFVIRTATEGEILHNPTAPGMTVFRFAANPHVLVLDFATMEQQGLALDRVAALIEKSDTPRDRVLDDAQLLAAIKKDGDTVATYYYGHDYSAASLRRFFTLADAEKVKLDPEEETLRRLLREQGWLTAGMRRGLISIPAVNAKLGITLATRAAILHHELAHGVFFSDADYQHYVHHFWDTVLTGNERAAVRRYLGSEGYDTTDEELMYNEMQAYLMFTQDPEFFRPQLIGMTVPRLVDLQRQFLAGMPKGWLADTLARTLAAEASATPGKHLARVAPN